VQVLGVAWLRIVSAALIFAAWRKPWRAWGELPPTVRRLLIGWGSVLAVMNCCFYEAIARLPLATVAAIEFLPVIGLAAMGARTRRNGAALIVAVAGVYLLTRPQIVGRPLGVAFAFANAILFASYIVLAHRVARHPAIAGIDGLAGAMLIAAVVVTPIAGRQAAPALTDPMALLAGIGVGVSSSVIPYVTDQVAMARLPRATYSLLVSLLPAIATVIGLVVLAQVPDLADVTGVACVVIGVALHRESAEERPARVRWGAAPSHGRSRGVRSRSDQKPGGRERNEQTHPCASERQQG
jgi:inner membrane transporter RhtA